jgi:hypothetical protein
MSAGQAAVTVAPTIEQAKRIAYANRAPIVIVLQVMPDERIGGASYGHTRALCDRGGRLLEAIADAMERGDITGETPKPKPSRVGPDLAAGADRAAVVEWVAERVCERTYAACGVHARALAGSAFAHYRELAQRVVGQVERWVREEARS